MQDRERARERIVTDRTPAYDDGPEADNPLGMSKYSIRRYSVQHFLLLIALLALIVALNVQAF